MLWLTQLPPELSKDSKQQLGKHRLSITQGELTYCSIDGLPVLKHARLPGVKSGAILLATLAAALLACTMKGTDSI
jgi:hypothetical protein